MNQRGLTLIETLAAVVLLAVIAASTLPILVGASADRVDRVSVDRLGKLADRVLADPGSFGLDIEGLIAVGGALIESDDPSETTEPTRVAVLHAQDTRVRHVWVEFSAGGTRVYRWLALPDTGEEDSP